MPLIGVALATGVLASELRRKSRLQLNDESQLPHAESVNQPITQNTMTQPHITHTAVRMSTYPRAHALTAEHLDLSYSHWW